MFALMVFRTDAISIISHLYMFDRLPREDCIWSLPQIDLCKYGSMMICANDVPVTLNPCATLAGEI